MQGQTLKLRLPRRVVCDSCHGGGCDGCGGSGAFRLSDDAEHRELTVVLPHVALDGKVLRIAEPVGSTASLTLLLLELADGPIDPNVILRRDPLPEAVDPLLRPTRRTTRAGAAIIVLLLFFAALAIAQGLGR